MTERLIPESGELLRMLDEATERWHDHAPAELATDETANDGLLTMILALHRYNFDLWHEEDEARNPDATDKRIADVKRAIDRLNQQRNDRVEMIDGTLSTMIRQHGTSRLHSETPAMIVDRLSIMSLKVYHTQEEIARQEATEDHWTKNRKRLEILTEQRCDVSGCLDLLMEEVLRGDRRFKVYRQMKMYNDPELNPVLYRRGGG